MSEEDIACLNAGDERFSPREAAALRFADLFAGDYMAIGDDTFAELRCQFVTGEIVELMMFCALMLAGGRMTYVLRGHDEEASVMPTKVAGGDRK